MARRGGHKQPPVPDFHLWEAVAQTVLPLKPHRRARPEAALPLPLPPSVPPAPRRTPALAMPAYQPPSTPGATPVGVIEPKLRKRLGRGRVSIDGTLDLHGLHQDEARAALTRFVSARFARGARTLLVITGKGLKKVNGDPTTIIERGVLRTMLPIWLNGPELRPIVAGWDQAAQGHGGEGAWYVRLRRESGR